MTQKSVPATDPAVYALYQARWSTLPDTAEAWLARAREVAEVLAQDVAQRDQENKSPRDDALKIPFASLLLPTIQLVFSNFYLGIAIGALEFAAKYTSTATRSWPFGGENKASATEEFYILERYGNFFAHLRATEALADRAGDQLSALYSRHSGDRPVLTAEGRGEIAEWVASVKATTTDVGLRVTSGVFEVTEARATALKVALVRFWRDLRTHTLHDPVAYKNRELGRYVLLHELPQPSWYT
ncbi:hypothetical protein NUU61_005586 [Penicillium alfredii]|uniref:Acyl-CoA dehydrogenase C-terminal domain-containing protein n=1 Tax=Penicillium alfredii TaxID=1506179 RepID=A0A9W9F9P3_9EURO|nr:uncharacterized protein NUU61_005586 [Penicillium alfredii]KAJ5096230.1 hypothetical protein NUU61_005586 [Penicillium alfredii]